MALSPGARLGPYEIVSLIGAGGMGEVFRARDTRLNRDVAIKVLPDLFARDPKRLARFQREAQVLASLNHPHIAHIHGLEESDGVRALVMELVEGEDLAERIARGAIHLDEALPIAMQIAEALEAAHEQGIIHRDLKPANVKVRLDGTVKVLDFGLAKALDPQSSSSAVAALGSSLTIASPVTPGGMTVVGTILGTAAYMSPEQAAGKPVDRRSDLWAFGVVILEMLGGRRAFTGETVSHVLASVLKSEPDWTALPPDTPAPIRRLLRRCLEKDRRRRLDSAADARLEIDEALTRVGDESPASVTTPGAAWRRALSWSVAAALAIAASGATWILRRPAPQQPVRLSSNLPAGQRLAGLNQPAVSISPDGRNLVYVAVQSGAIQQLYIRPLDSQEAKPISGTEGAVGPTDGQALLFVGSATGASWGLSHIAVEAIGESQRPSASPMTILAQGTQPRYAPTGHLLYAQSGTLMAAPFDARRLSLTGAAVPALEGVMQSNTTGAAQYSLSSTGTLVYVAEGLALGQSRLAWVGRDGKEQLLPAVPHNYAFPRVSPDGRRIAVELVEQEEQTWVYDVARDNLTRLAFEGKVNNIPAWSPDGNRIVFSSNRSGVASNLFWMASNGSGAAERLTTSDQVNFPDSFSPDGKLLAYVEVTPETGSDIWVLRMSDRKAQPFLQAPYEEAAPAFSPDGRWLAYSSDESGRREIIVQPYPGPGGKWQVSTEGGQEPLWNPKGGELFYRNGSTVMAVDVEARSGFSAGKPRVLFEGPYLSGGGFPFYDVGPDGQRFLMLKPVDSPTSAPTQINVVLNWFEELKRVAASK